MPWSQVYDPFASPTLSALAAALPIIVLLGALALLRLPAYLSAILGLLTALAIAVAFGMPAPQAALSAAYGAAYGLFPIGWVIVNIVFLYNLANERGLMRVVQATLTGITPDRRLQLILVAFCFGAFFEGAAGFGTPIAVTAALLVALGFPAIPAAVITLIANTAPVCFAGLGTPMIALQGVTGLDMLQLSAVVARILFPFALIVPFWMIWSYAGFRRMVEVWPAALVAGGTYASVQLLVASLHGPWLAAVLASLASTGALVALLLRWQPHTIYRGSSAVAEPPAATRPKVAYPRATMIRAWAPWAVLTVTVFVWSLPATTAALNDLSAPAFAVAGLHNLVERVPPVVAVSRLESAVFSLNWLSVAGSGALFAALITTLILRYTPAAALGVYVRTLRKSGLSLLTIAATMALGFVMRYAGLDGSLGVVIAQTGAFYPFFGTLLGWLGVAVTGSDTSSNVLFGSLQRITAEKLGLSSVLMAAANSAGGVMGKMIGPQSIVVATTATDTTGQESEILRRVFGPSIALAALVALWVTIIAYLLPGLAA